MTETPEILFGDSVRWPEQDEDGVDVTFEHAPSRRFDLVIGADRLPSPVRRIAFGPDAAFERNLGYCAAAFTVRGYPHRDEAAYVSYCIPGAQVARYALRHDRTAFFIIFDARTAPAALCADAHGQQALLQHLLCNAGWECPAILDAVRSCDDFYFDAVTQLRMDHWSRGRVALVGDAAFCPSLLAGEGSSLAMAGAYVLAGERASSPADHRRAFTGYEATFKPFVDGKQPFDSPVGSRRARDWASACAMRAPGW